MHRQNGRCLTSNSGSVHIITWTLLRCLILASLNKMRRLSYHLTLYPLPLSHPSLGVKISITDASRVMGCADSLNRTLHITSSPWYPRNHCNHCVFVQRKNGQSCLSQTLLHFSCIIGVDTPLGLISGPAQCPLPCPLVYSYRFLTKNVPSLITTGLIKWIVLSIASRPVVIMSVPDDCCWYPERPQVCVLHFLHLLIIPSGKGRVRRMVRLMFRVFLACEHPFLPTTTPPSPPAWRA